MEDCLFCKIAGGQIPSVTVYEDEHFRVFLDLNQALRGHLLIVPKAHYASLSEVPEDLLKESAVLTQKVAEAAVRALHADGVNIIQNNGQAAGQSVPHFHIHVLPRVSGDAKLFALREEKVSSGEMNEIAGKIRENL